MNQVLALAWIGLAVASGDVQDSYRHGEEALAKGDLTESGGLISAGASVAGE